LKYTPGNVLVNCEVSEGLLRKVLKRPTICGPIVEKDLATTPHHNIALQFEPCETSALSRSSNTKLGLQLAIAVMLTAFDQHRVRITDKSRIDAIH
jgi:hypothetical protein